MKLEDIRMERDHPAKVSAPLYVTASEIMGSEEGALAWFNFPNRELKNKTPLYACQNGQITKVDNLLNMMKYQNKLPR